MTVTEETCSDDGKPDLLLSMDKAKLQTVGKAAIADFLRKLQVQETPFASTVGI